MANYAETQAPGKVEHLTYMVAAVKENLAAWYQHRRLYQNSVQELRALSNRQLADLGLNRSMIKSVALEAADQRAKR